ncbi:MAG: TIGR03960 family B12-binding radical SAM protein [Alphaproteobacteria bacterium]|nr:TIGR03960 family B12-binding radical SAM protein [Alphaproteobacteria bacterium]
MHLPHALEEILAEVEKPSRYLGNEVNAVIRDPSTVDVRIALTFPDLYDIGLGNLGVHILYAILNQLDWVYCERAYAPAIDMEQALRARGMELFALESKDPLSRMDAIGFTLQSELTFTNILNIIDLSGMSVRTSGRRESDPLTFAGGPAVFNPEPLAPFMDFFVIGDGEDVIVEIAQVLRDVKGRQARLEALARLEGVYVPALYPFDTLPDGQILPAVDGPRIRKRITRDLNGATFPVDYIVPYTQQVHDRISLEVLRGCTQGCRFCQAGMTTRPVRERSLENIDALLQRTLDATGYEEVSLVSLSTCDYSRVRQLVENTVETARPRNVAVSLPSLRLDSYSVELADMVAETRRTGLTVAPEAASPRLRAVINKWIPDDELLEMSTGAFALGWTHVKMYFMIGLPTERDDDILAIGDLAGRALAKGKEHFKKARVNLGVSTFVPKPFTPFQWARQIGLNETVRKQDLLAEDLRDRPGVKFGRHEPEETFLEGLVSRADRRAADLIELAWRKGCRFDAWREHLRFDLWGDAIEELGYDVQFALRERSTDERLPWDHIDVLIHKEWFVADWERAKKLEHAQDCRHRKCHKCGVIDHERELCASMLRTSIKGRTPESAWERKPEPAVRVSPDPVQRLWFRISRVESGRYLTHLEAMHAWVRALRRAEAPLAYSQGFHPHPKVAFSSAMPQNQASIGEYLDVSLTERVDPGELAARLATVLPAGFGIHGHAEVDLRAPSLMSLVEGAVYTVYLPELTPEQLEERVATVLAADELPVERRRKSKNKRGKWKSGPRTAPVDIRPMIQALTVRETTEVPAVDVVLHAVEGKGPKMRELLDFLAPESTLARVLRRETLVRSGDSLVALSSCWERYAPGAEAPPAVEQPAAG